MIRHLTTGALAAGLLALSLNASAQSSMQQSPPSTAMPPPATGAAPQSFTDAQVQEFAAASVEIDRIRNSTTDQSAQMTQMRAALQRHQLTGAQYNAIASAAQSDPNLAQKVASYRAKASGAG